MESDGKRTNNRLIEQRAIEFVASFEKQHRRGPARNVASQHLGYDVESRGRKIEVKGFRANYPGFANFNEYNFKALQREDNFFLYIVCNVNEKPRLAIFDKNQTLKNLKFSPQWCISVRQNDFRF
ncbi:MAG: hypothetical protein A3A43_02415 [Candidatus Liptonbacteria bacterium RIFCSPLOWO2_01_FULL_56_20]|uniref:Protein NO VEIN C-terminal domain-containing protein n=1 Tax=Candidatus Liptonbacteria bacterium RIFCSPLOWO2_01_FULL_56_20 TaxID=1798652 RepID=A0A1G2CHX5_9BACT|nr:MAG: hypothetical protein A2681_00420 [Candidatus Liptonbacteria bacterium RIFCSPHIGHO2_01_FULL_56_18b]OGZ00827.1 MAG: hypothetical protein A3A43_02415 [Candidatus Liptonbacteria bacterium RIFCSPLOWO2_01_FULL_56_20]